MSVYEPHDAVRDLLVRFGGWAIGDEYDRGIAVEAASDVDRGALVAAVDALPPSVWDWLAGPDSYSSEPSADYIAVSDIVASAELARVYDGAQ